ncbi:MAG: thrombospondin type 3 repeat-containing protein, partial [Prosthecobacter sp.]
MLNAWEARYNLNFRDARDADIVAMPDSGPTPPGQLVTRTDMARYKDEYNLIREYPAAFLNGGLFTKVEWEMMNRVDPDHDGLPNILECKVGGNPRLPDLLATLGRDTDQDGYSDTEELLAGSDYLDASSNPSTLPSGTGDTGTTPTPPGTPPPLPNPPFKLVWNAPTVSASYSKGYKSTGELNEATTGGSKKYYKSGSTTSTGESWSFYDSGKPKSIGDIIPKCTMPTSDAFAGWDKTILGELFQSEFIAAELYTGTGSASYKWNATKTWNYTRAQVKAKTLDLLTPVELNQPVKVPCLRIKERWSIQSRPPTIAALQRTEILGTYTFTIPAGHFKSEVFPQLLSFPLTHPADTDTNSFIYRLLPVEIEVKHTEKERDDEGNELTTTINPGATTLLRDEIADLRIKVPTMGNADWDLKLELEPADMKTQTLDSRGAVQMYDFGTIDPFGTITPLSANANGTSKAGPYDIKLLAGNGGDETFKIVVNKEGKFKLRLKSADNK